MATRAHCRISDLLFDVASDDLHYLEVMDPTWTEGAEPVAVRRVVKRRMFTPPIRGGRSSDRDYRMSTRDSDMVENTRYAHIATPTREQMQHENRVFNETVEQVKRKAIEYANIRNQQCREAAQRYSQHAKQVCRHEVQQTEEMRKVKCQSL